MGAVQSVCKSPPDQSIGFVGGVHAELDALDDLRWQFDAWVVLEEALTSVPSHRLLLHGYRPEARWRPPEVFLLRQRLWGVRGRRIWGHVRGLWVLGVCVGFLRHCGVFWATACSMARRYCPSSVK